MENIENLSTLPNQIVQSALIDIIENKFNISNYKLIIESGSAKGDNYIGIIYRAKIIWSNNDNNKLQNGNNKLIEINSNNEEISIIIKVPPQNEIRREQFFARPCFVREALVYDEILPLFKNFQNSKGISDNNGFMEYPECYRTITDEKYEAIFLKDLGMDNFIMFNRLESVTFDHVKLIMIILGKYHAVSFAIKDQLPEKIKEYEKLEDIFTQRDNDETLLQYFEALKTRAIDTLCKIENNDLIEKIENLFGKKSFFDILKKIVNGKEAEPYAVLCHGDCWNNNILFKYENNKPIDARLIDWQILRYASPVCDLMYYLFTCTTKKLRDQHYHELLNIYYDTLSGYLKTLGSNPEKVYPKIAFENGLKKFGYFGLLMAMMVLPIFTSDAADIPDLDELSEKLQAGELDVDESFKSKTTIDVYRKRMRNVIIDLGNLGYI